MHYITHIQLNDRPGARELAQVAAPEHKPMVSYELMEATLLGADRSTFESDDVAIADEALARIDDAIADAQGVIDAHLLKRGYQIPFGQVPRLLTSLARAIVRYFLHKDRANLDNDDTLVRDYKDALKQLQLIADGKISLGLQEELVETGLGMPQITKGSSRIRDALKGF